MASTYDIVKDFKRRYPQTVCWRVKKHCALIDQNLNNQERVLYAFAAQNDLTHGSIFNTAVLALTNERIIIAQDRILVGYKVSTITPDQYNDMQINAGIIWGTVTIDTLKETIFFSNISKKALPEIQIQISSFMIEAKKKYHSKEKDSNWILFFKKGVVKNEKILFVYKYYFINIY